MGHRPPTRVDGAQTQPGFESVSKKCVPPREVQAECNQVRADHVGFTADTMSCRIARVAGFGRDHRLRRKSEQSQLWLWPS